LETVVAELVPFTWQIKVETSYGTTAFYGVVLKLSILQVVLHFQMMCIKRLPVPKSRSYRMPVSAFGNIFMLLIITDQFSLNQSLLTDLKKTRAKLRKLNPH
jgi:hypothetical protein